MGQERAAPAPGTKGADGGQGENSRRNGDDWAIGGQVIGRRSCRRADQRPVADQLAHTNLAVDGDAQLGGLAGLTQKRDLIDREGLVLTPLGIDRDHHQRMDNGPLGGIDPLEQFVLAIFVHQKADRPPVHAVDRGLGAHGPVQGFEHEAVTAKSNNHLGLFKRHIAIACGQSVTGLLRFGTVAGDKGEAATDGFCSVHSPWTKPALAQLVKPALHPKPISGPLWPELG